MDVVNNHIEIGMKALARELHEHLDKEKEKQQSALEQKKKVRMASELSPSKKMQRDASEGQVDGRYK